MASLDYATTVAEDIKAAGPSTVHNEGFEARALGLSGEIVAKLCSVGFLRILLQG